LVIHRLKTFTASESLNGFSEALRPDLLVFPFAQQEFDRSWRQREFLWRFSLRASQYRRTRSAVLVLSPVPRYGCGPGTLVNAIRSAVAFVILPGCFASVLSLATPDEMPKVDKTTIKITERRKSLGFMMRESIAFDVIPHRKISDLKASGEKEISMATMPGHQVPALGFQNKAGRGDSISEKSPVWSPAQTVNPPHPVGRHRYGREGKRTERFVRPARRCRL